ncbi:MAG: UDP-N-acetylmuramate dehydrogenase [Clostridia bacterium]|nr:UDP-N-acetylmuramate dehydrogenase [Clostridia bacterium]
MILALTGAATAYGCGIARDVPMAELTSFRIGGPADLMITLPDVEAAAAVNGICEAENWSRLWLGRGSNLLVSDTGFRGVVLRLSNGSMPKRLDETRLSCFAGVTLPSLSRFAQLQGLTGLEFACGIPGSVGGAVLMNAGAYGGCMADVLESVTILRGDRAVDVPAAELELGYRHSKLMQTGEPVVAATFRLRAGDPAAIDARMTELLTARREKQPLEYPSAGSFFKRPEGYFAGALIEQCGLKGYAVGDAEVSAKHAGFIVNKGSATCTDVQKLAQHVRRTVKHETGVLLQPEVRLIGEDWYPPED